MDGGLIYRTWKAPAPRACFLLVHGLGAHPGRWEYFADFFLKNDFSSYAIELDPLDSFTAATRGIAGLDVVIRKENAAGKVFLVGESMGALISFLMVGQKRLSPDGLVCLSPAFAHKIPFSFFDYVRVLSAKLTDPRKRLDLPFTPQMCTRDVAYQKVMEAEEAIHRHPGPDLLFSIVAGQIRVKLMKSKITTPVLFLLAGDDKLVDSRVSKKVFDDLETEDKTIIEYPGMYHALSIDLGRERVFEDILRWAVKEREKA